MAATSKQYTISQQLGNKILKAMGFKNARIPRHSFPNRMILLIGGAPADNTAATDPLTVNTLGYDGDNDDVYICTAYTDSTTHTWTKITN